MRLGRIRGRLIAPGNGVDVKAIAGVARALRGIVQVQFERSQLRVFADHARGELVRGGCQANFDTGASAVPSVNSREPDRRGSRMVAGAVAKGVGLQMR